MELIVDGIIYHYQKYGGISRLFTEILPRLCIFDPELNVKLLIYPDSYKELLPRHERINLKYIPNINRYIRPRRFWSQYYIQLSQLVARGTLGSSKGKIWLSTYYTSPIAWVGRNVCIVYDLIYEKYQMNKQHTLPQTDETIEYKVAAIAKSDLVICISETTQQELLEFYQIPINKTTVVHLAYKPLFSFMANIDKQKESFILYVGNRGYYKNFDFLLRAYATWSGRFEYGMVCAGGGEWTEQERQAIFALKLDNLISLYPQVDDQQLCNLYNKASAFIYPSQYEGFGIPLLEAMACGCPIVASRIPSSIEIAADVPIYFTSGNIDEMIVALDKTVREGRSSQRIAEGLALVGKYSWDKTAQGFLKAFQTLV